LGTSACLFFCAGYVTHRIVDLVLFGNGAVDPQGLDLLVRRALAWYYPAALFLAGGWLVLPGVRELLATGAIQEHWSRFIVMSFLYAVGAVLLGTRFIDYSLNLMGDRLHFLRTCRELPEGQVPGNQGGTLSRPQGPRG
jgi:hypothetical protein